MVRIRDLSCFKGLVCAHVLSWVGGIKGKMVNSLDDVLLFVVLLCDGDLDAFLSYSG